MKNCLAETKTNNFDVTLYEKDITSLYRYLYLTRINGFSKTLYTKYVILNSTVIMFELKKRGLSTQFVLNYNSGSVQCTFNHTFWKHVEFHDITYPIRYYIRSSYISLFKQSKQYLSCKNKFLRFRSYGDDILFSGQNGTGKYLLEGLPSYTFQAPMPQDKKEMVGSHIRCMFRMTYIQFASNIGVFYAGKDRCDQRDKITFTFVKNKPISVYYTGDEEKEQCSLFAEHIKPLVWNHDEEYISVEYLYAAFLYAISGFGIYDIRAETPLELYITDTYDMCLYFKYNNVDMNIRIYSGITLKELKKEAES